MRVKSINKIYSVETIKPKVSDASFIDIIKSIENTDAIESQQIIKYSNTASYILDISARGVKAVEEYKDDSYPIINSNVFSYNKNLGLIYKI
jgi:hypothetical protein